MSAAVAERGASPVVVLRQQLDSMEGQFKAALPAHIPVERFARVAMTAVQNNPELMECERRSLFNALVKAAQDGLLPDGREGAVVVRLDRQRGKIANWQPMIAGLRKKVRNSGEIATWDAYVVYANDEFDYELGDDPFIKHKPTLDEPGPVIAAYSIATLKSGEKTRDVMSVAAINLIRDKTDAYKAFKAGKIKSTPWNDHYDEMAKKTVARRHSKVLPMSTDLDDLLRRDDDLYDYAGAREDAKAAAEGRPQSLSGRLDALARIPAAVPDAADPETGEIAESDDRPIGDGSASGEKHTAPVEAQTQDEGVAGASPGDAGGEPNAAPSLDVARRRARENHARGMARKAAPGEYREKGREAELEAYLGEFDRVARLAEAEAAKRVLARPQGDAG